jgi:hypothetical protein
MPAAKVKERQKPIVTTSRGTLPYYFLEKDWREAGYRYGRWEVTVPEDLSFTDCLREEVWRSIAPRLKADPRSGRPAQIGGIIELRAWDLSWYAELIILDVLPGGLDVGILKQQTMVQREVPVPDDDRFEVRWNINKRGFDILRNSDRAVVADAAVIRSKPQAYTWINSQPKD